MVFTGSVPFRCFSRHITTLPTSRRNSSMRKLDDRTGSGSEVVTQMHILWISARRQSSCQTLPTDDHFALSETRYVAVRSRSLESSGTVSDVTYTIHPYHFSSMLMELGWTTTMTRCALDPDGTTVGVKRSRYAISVFGILGSTADTVQTFEDFHYFLLGNVLRLHRHFFPSVITAWFASAKSCTPNVLSSESTVFILSFLCLCWFT